MRVTFLFLSAIVACLANESWKVVDVDRVVDLHTQIIKIVSLVTYENTDTSDQKSVLFALPVNESEHISYTVVREDGAKTKLKVSKQNIEKGFQIYKVDLPKSVAKGSQIKLKIEHRVIGLLTPFPAAIAQNKPQYIKMQASTHFASPYTVAKEKTTYKIPEKLVGSSTSGKVIYGPYTNQPAFNSKFTELHYECNFPFVVATVVERTIEVSHWGGNIAVEEYIELENKGALLQGTFSRLDHSSDRRGQSQRPHLQHFTTILPAAAKDIYYRDEIGNISTSSVRVRTDSVELTITPRFPLFGGWRTSYVIGYNVPSYEYLHNNGNNYALKMRVLDHIFDNIVVEKLTTKIILPEFVKNVKVNTPYTMERRPDDIKPSYLDTTGRLVITLQKDSVIADHIQPFTVYYDFDSINLVREPFIAFCFYFAIFVAVIVYVRFDFSLSSDPAAQAAQKIGVLIKHLEALAARKGKLYSNLSEAVAAFKESREKETLTEAKKSLDDGRNAVNCAMTDIIGSIKENNADAGEKAAELLKYDKALYDSVEGYIDAAIKSKQKTCPEDAKFREKTTELHRRAERILDSLHIDN